MRQHYRKAIPLRLANIEGAGEISPEWFEAEAEVESEAAANYNAHETLRKARAASRTPAPAG